jgi:hypothetical protein
VSSLVAPDLDQFHRRGHVRDDLRIEGMNEGSMSKAHELIDDSVTTPWIRKTHARGCVVTHQFDSIARSDRKLHDVTLLEMDPD